MELKFLQNLHTHSVYDDGADTPEEIVLQAIEMDFDSVGFSGHAYARYGSKYCMTPESTLAFYAEINRLKQKYAGRLKIFLGLEVDMLEPADLSPLDYSLGACHYLQIGSEIVGIDRKFDEVKLAADRYFGGDTLKLARCYYRQLAELPACGNFDIIAHFDLIAKNREKAELFDIDCPAYRACALEAVDALKGRIPLFEVNTGAISRGYRTTPYPDMFILKALKQAGFGPVISSDCHKKETLACGFDQALELLKAAGFGELYHLDEGGFVGEKIR